MRVLLTAAVAAVAAVVVWSCSGTDALAECARQERCLLLDAGTPTPRYPANGAATGSSIAALAGDPTVQHPQLTWDAPFDSNWIYRVQLARCPDGGATEAQCPYGGEVSSGLPDSGSNSYEIAQELELGRRYYWRVRACDSAQPGTPCGPWSSSRHFNVGHPEAHLNDVTGDGTSDILVANAPATAAGQPTPIYVFSGGFDSRPLVGTVDVGAGQSSSYGVELGGIGDFNGDGASDFAVSYRNGAGAPSDSPVEIYLGVGGGGLPALPMVTLSQDVNSFGHPVVRAGDVNGDGRSDVLVGQRGQARALLFLGVAVPTAVILPPSGDAVLALSSASTTGLAIANAGDMNGDGLDDVVIAGDAELKAFHGRSPATGTWSGVTLALPPSPPYSLATGDFDGDGYSDFVVAGSSGSAKLYRGSAAFFASASAGTDLPVQGASTLQSTGDVNGDGRDDLIAAMQTSVVVYLGNAGVNAVPSAVATINGAGTFGVAAVGAGDITNDNFADLVIGSDEIATVFPGGDSPPQMSALRSDLDAGVPPRSFGNVIAPAY